MCVSSETLVRWNRGVALYLFLGWGSNCCYAHAVTGRSKGYAFIEYKHKEDADDAWQVKFVTFH